MTPACVAIGSTVSGLVGLVAASVPDGLRVLAPEIEFTATYFGPPLRLARGARRLDTSPAWYCWVGTQPALELVNRIGVETVHEHDVALANQFRAGLGLPPTASAIVSVDAPGAAERLERAGIVAAVRGGRLRASWHVYNTARGRRRCAGRARGRRAGVTAGTARARC